ncbi:hypothetical protein BVRB_6g139870 [Beta vulgaris subsp. vulgaris]|nr:hypothetical protein BVRB_6g139870 [Beta vulgaris subsp. vulgaris]
MNGGRRGKRYRFLSYTTVLLCLRVIQMQSQSSVNTLQRLTLQC